MKFYLKLITVFITWCTTCHGADILYISLTPSPSHHIWDKTLAMALRAKQHRITFLTHSVEKNLDNFTVIHFEGIYEKLLKKFNYEEFSSKTNLAGIVELYDWFQCLCGWDFKTKGFLQLMDLINTKPKFDLIIFDMTSGHCMYPIIEKLNFPPVIATSQFGLAPYYTFHFGTNLNTAYIPIYFLPYTDQLTFVERFTNLFYTLVFLLYREYIFMPSVWKEAQEIYGKNIKTYKEFETNVSLLLVNFDHVLDYPQTLPPAIIPVGGLHTKREKSLSKDLQNILDEAKEGVILFSLGTNFLSADLKADQRQALVEGLGRMKQIVLWKFEKKINGLPKNIIARPWLPQNDILAHPNLVAFLTHGGGLSTQEAVFHGVPVICMPFFADQILNTRKMVTRKLGQYLEYGKLTPDIVYNIVSEVVNNITYKKNMIALSKRYKDQPEDPLTRAIWWIEYTVRQNGAHHLRIGARDLPFYKLYLLDVWALIIAIILIPLSLIAKFTFCRTKPCKSNKTKND